MLEDELLPLQRRAEHIMAMPAVPPSNRLRKSWTAREVRQLIADNPFPTPRYELVDGELLVTPSPIPRHQRAVTLLAYLLEQYVERNPVGVVYVSPSDVELEPGQIVQPDVFVVPVPEARRIQEAWPARELLLAAEVLSPSTSRDDKVTKRLLYGRHVPEYWIVDLDARIIERWQQHADQPQVLVTALEWQPTEGAELFRLDLEKFFAAVFMEPRPPDA